MSFNFLVLSNIIELRLEHAKYPLILAMVKRLTSLEFTDSNGIGESKTFTPCDEVINLNPKCSLVTSSKDILVINGGV